MIYSASLGSQVKRSQKDKAFVTQLDRIIAQLPLDPGVSNMDAVILGPKDVAGINAAKIQTAIKNKHPDVCVIYLFNKDHEKDLIDCEYKKMIKRIDERAVTDAVSEFLGDHLIKAGKLEVNSEDFEISAGNNEDAGAYQKRKPVEAKEEEKEEEVATFKLPDLDQDITTGEFIEDDNDTDGGFVPPAPSFADDNTWTCTCGQVNDSNTCTNCGSFRPGYEPPKKEEPPQVDMSIDSIKNFHDFEILKRELEKDNVIAAIIAENADFERVSQMLDILDSNIKTIFLDTSLTAEERYARIKDAGLQRSEFKGRQNDMIIKKTMSIFDRITSIVDSFVDKKVGDMEKALTKITVDKASIENGGIDIQNLIQERTKMEFELMELMRNVLDIYKSMDVLTSTELTELDTNLPSSNDFVNNILAPSRKMFTPQNTGALATAIMTSLQNQRMSMSALENRIKAVINIIFEICNQNDMIIEYQANLIKLLKANKVEDIVVVDTMLKGVLRLFIAEEDTGATATILTHSGLLSRTANTLVVDISGNGKFEDYGMTVHEWDDFINERPHENLCIVRADGSDPEKVHNIVTELKKFLDYYRYINVKIDYTQVDAVNQLCDDAIIAHIVSDCRSSNIRKLRPAVDAIWTKNIAKKLILIDAPSEDIVNITKEIGCDVLTTKVIPIPHLTEIKGCAISRKRPYLNEGIAKIFEGAFR